MLVTRHSIWINDWVYRTLMLIITNNYNGFTNLSALLQINVLQHTIFCVFTSHCLWVLLLWYTHYQWMVAGLQLTHEWTKLLGQLSLYNLTLDHIENKPPTAPLLCVYLLPSNGLLVRWCRSVFTMPLPSNRWHLFINYSLITCYETKVAGLISVLTHNRSVFCY